MTKTTFRFDQEWHIHTQDLYPGCGMEREGEIHATLEEYDGSNNGSFAHDNDFGNTSTVTQTPCDPRRDCNSHIPGPLQIYRMTMLETTKPLDQFKCSKDFIQAIKDAMEAHDAAFFSAGILHRDISVGNILICDGGGLLIDWDFCTKATKKEGLKSRRTNRTGTWQFMSAKILEDHMHQHDILDDQESAYHVITWLALCFTDHNKLDVLYAYLRHFHQFIPLGRGLDSDKSTAFLISTIPSRPTFKNVKLNGLIVEMMRALAFRYKKVKYEDRRRLQEHERRLKDLDSKIADINSQLEQFDKEFINAPAADAYAIKDILKRILHTAIAHKILILEEQEKNSAIMIPKQLKEINERGWLVNILQRYLAQDDWPTDDVANPYKYLGAYLPMRFRSF